MDTPRRSPTPLTPDARPSKLVPTSTRNRAQSVQVMVRIAYGDGTISALARSPQFGAEELERGLDAAEIREIAESQLGTVLDTLDKLGVAGVYNTTKEEVKERRRKMIDEAKLNFARHRGLQPEDVVIKKGVPSVKPGIEPVPGKSADGDGERGSDDV